tara:strand:+ start:1444 stop:1719 length:276 start_codon:yes stop_codon:yes gene_type:complete
MATPIKFTEEELKQVTELRDASQAKVVEFGQLKLERILTENRLTQLDQLDEEAKNSYVELQKQEAELVEQLKEKYGAGTVDVESGEFVPAK